MKKIILCALISLLSLAITGCDEFGKYSVSPHDNSTNTFELLFDEIGQSMLIKKEISIDISDDSNYTGNFVGPAGVVTMEYTLHNTTDEPVDFQMLWIYPIYGSSNLSNLFETLVLEIDDVVQERIYNVIRSEEHTSELQSRPHLVCRLLLEKKKIHNSAEATDAAHTGGSLVSALSHCLAQLSCVGGQSRPAVFHPSDTE